MGVTAVLRIKAKYAAASKGSETSGNWGHAGRPGQVGGSGPGGAPGVIGKSFYRFGDNPDDTPAEHIYDGSSPEVQELARNIGVIATSDETMEYARDLLKNNQDEVISAAKREGGYKKTWINRMKLDDEAIAAKRAEISDLMSNDGILAVNKLKMVSRKQFTDAGYDGTLYDKAMAIKRDLYDHPADSMVSAITGGRERENAAYLEEAKHYIPLQERQLLQDAWQKAQSYPSYVDVSIMTPEYLEKRVAVIDHYWDIHKQVADKVTLQVNRDYGFDRLPESDRQQILEMTQKAYIRNQMTGTMGQHGWTKKLLETYKGAVPKGKINNISISDMPKVLTAKSIDEALHKYAANKLGIANFNIYDMSELGGKFTPAQIRSGFGIQPNAMNALHDLRMQDLDAIRFRFEKSTEGHEQYYPRMGLQGIFGINPQQAVLTRFHKIADIIGNIKSGLYHGAPYFAIQRIASGGYIEHGNPMSSLGKGVYLAPIAGKSAQYAQKGMHHQERGVLLDNLVALGKMADVSKGTLKHILRSKAWDSVYTGTEGVYHNPEYLVRNASAVLPKYWLDLLIGST